MEFSLGLEFRDNDYSQNFLRCTTEEAQSTGMVVRKVIIPVLSSVAMEWVAILPYILEVRDSNLSFNSDYPTDVFLVLCQLPCASENLSLSVYFRYLLKCIKISRIITENMLQL
jgi:hypothetical protein